MHIKTSSRLFRLWRLASFFSTWKWDSPAPNNLCALMKGLINGLVLEPILAVMAVIALTFIHVVFGVVSTVLCLLAGYLPTVSAHHQAREESRQQAESSNQNDCSLTFHVFLSICDWGSGLYGWVVHANRPLYLPLGIWKLYPYQVLLIVLPIWGYSKADEHLRNTLQALGLGCGSAAAAVLMVLLAAGLWPLVSPVLKAQKERLCPLISYEDDAQ